MQTADRTQGSLQRAPAVGVAAALQPASAEDELYGFEFIAELIDVSHEFAELIASANADGD